MKMRETDDEETNINEDHDQLPSLETYKASIGYTRSGRSKPDPTGIQVDSDNLEHRYPLDHDQLPVVDEYKISQAHDSKHNGQFWKIAAFSIISILLAVILGLTIPLATNSEDSVWWLVDSDRYSAVEKYLIGANISTATNLKNESSPQHKAAKWLANKDGMRLSIPHHVMETAPPSFVERYALAVFYFATGGPNWTYPLNFLTDNHVCAWYQPFTVKIADDADLEEEYITLGVHGCKLVDDELVPFAMFLRAYLIDDWLQLKN